MAVRRTGTEFTLVGLSRFLSGLNRINKEFRSVADTATKMGNMVARAGARVDRANQQVTKTQKSLAVARGNVTRATKSMLDIEQKYVAGSKQVIDATNKLQKRKYELANAERFYTNALMNTTRAEEGLADAETVAGMAMNKSVNIVSVLAGGFGALAGAVGFAAQIMGSFLGVIIKVGRTVISALIAPLKSLASFTRDVLANAFGFLLRDSIQSAIDSLNRLKDAIVGIISDFQTLEIRLQNLVARELRASGAIDDVAESFTAAVKPAEELSQWIRTLSLQVPFSVADIANTTAFAMAMGFTIDEAKALTLSIGNFTAGMGLSSDKMESMIFNFGQMKAAGKVTGTEMRDLARGSFFPLVDVLDEAAKMMGIVTNDIMEFRKQAAAGEVPIDVFFSAFQKVVERDFPAAMERMKGTLQGVITRLKNFGKTILGIELFGPVAKQFAMDVSNALDKIMTPAVQRAANLIGQVLVAAYTRFKLAANNIGRALKNLASAFGVSEVNAWSLAKVIIYIAAFIRKAMWVVADVINWIADKINTDTSKIGEGMYQKGVNIIATFAKGMAAALIYVVTVINKLAQLLTYWLKGHSPPRLLPNLDKWGAEAMTAYMKGWLDADFGVFNDIADKMESYVRSIAETIVKEVDVVPMVLRLRDNLAKAMQSIRKGGKIDVGQILKGFKNATPELQNYVRMMLKMAEAEAKVADAQDELNKVTQHYESILKPLYKQLDLINDATSDLDDDRRATQLRLILADVNASEGDKQRARLELERMALEKNIRAVENERDEAVDASEAKLAAAEAYRDALEEELKAAEGLVDVQIKTNELIKEQLDLLESLKNAGTGGLGEPEDGFGFDLGGIGFDPEEFPDWGAEIDKMFLQATLDIEQFADDISAAIGGAFDPLMGEDGLLAQLQSNIADLFSGEGISADSPFMQAMREFQILISLIKVDLSILGVVLSNIGKIISSALGEDNGESTINSWQLLAAAIYGVVTVLFAIITPIIIVGGILVATLVGAIDYVVEKFILWQTEMQRIFNNLGVNLLSIILAIGFSMSMAFQTFFGLIAKIVFGFVKSVFEFFKGLYNDLVGNSIIPDMLADITAAFVEFFASSLTSLGEWITTVVEDLADLAKDAYEEGKNFIQGLWKGVEEKIEPFLEWLNAKWEAILDLWDKITDSQSPSREMVKRGSYLMEGLAIGIQKSLGAPQAAMGYAAQNVMAPAVYDGGNTVNSTVNNSYTLNMPTTASPASVQRSYEMMRLLNA